MKWQLIIEGDSFSDLQGIITTIPERKLNVITEVPAKTKKLKDPDTGEIHIVAKHEPESIEEQVTTVTESKDRKCVVCGKHYTSKRKTTKHCSKKCYMLEFNGKRKVASEKKEDRVCTECGKKFKPAQKNSRFCSKKHANAHVYRMKKQMNIQVEPADALPFDFKKKLNEIRETCPAPKPRPDFQRDFNS
ncbi:MAG: hypothetical protein WCL00_02180 [Bacteroidota bacterium]